MSFGGSGGSGSIHASSDVALSNPADADVLTYVSSLGKWQNRVAASLSKIQALGNVSGTIACDLSQASTFTATLTNDVSMSFINWPSLASEPMLILTQDGTGGHNITVNGITWLPTGAAPNNLATGAGGTTVISLLSPDGGATIYGDSGPQAGTSAGTFAAGNDSRLAGALQAVSNLADVGSALAARTNLGLGSAYSTLDPNGAIGVKRTAVADTAYGVLATDYLVAYSTLTAARTVTLPSAAGIGSRVYVVVDETGSANTYNITVATSGGQKINGASSQAITTAYGSLKVYSNGTNWFVLP